MKTKKCPKCEGTGRYTTAHPAPMPRIIDPPPTDYPPIGDGYQTRACWFCGGRGFVPDQAAGGAKQETGNDTPQG